MEEIVEEIVDFRSEDWDLLYQAFARNDVALIECQEVATGDVVAVIAITRPNASGDGLEFLPFAQMYKDNPYHEWCPPNPDGGFFPALDEEEE